MNLLQVYKDMSAIHDKAAPGAATPVREQIMDNLVTALEGILVVNGYANNVRKVERVVKPGVNLAFYPAIVVVEPDEQHVGDANQGPLGLISCHLQVVIQFWLTENNEAAQGLNLFLADGQKAVLVDPSRAGLALDTELLNNALIVDEAGQPLGVNQLALMIKYRYSRNDPTEVR